MRLKKYLIGILIICFMFTFCINAFADINDGLVSYYPFNGNADDESGNGNDGTVYGATLATDRFGNPNSAYDFDGFNDYISVADVPSLNFQPNDTMSISLWISWGAYQGVMHIIGKRFGCSYPNPLHYQMAHDGGGIQFGQEYPDAISAGISPPVGTWTHLVGLFDGNDYRFFMNGIQIAETINATLGASTSAELKIGTSGGCDHQKFNGSIDEVRIYNRALSESDILELYGVGFTCPISLALEGNEAQLDAIRYFRDNVLTYTPEGRKIIKMYYEWSPVIVEAMGEDEEFKEEVKEMIDGVLLLIGH